MHASIEITADALKKFRPLDRLSENQRILLAHKAHFSSFKKKKVVFERGTFDHHDYFLLNGKIELEAPDGRTREIDAGTEQADAAIAHLQPRQYTVKAVTDVDFLIIEKDVLNILLKQAPVHNFEADEGFDDGDAEDVEGAFKVLMSFYHDLKSNNFTLPSLPDVAYRIRQIAGKNETSADDISKVVNTDPAMTVKLIKSCNSPLYRGFNEVSSCRDAVVRLGIQTTQQLVTVFSMRELFRSKKPELKQAMSELWQHSREVASIAYVLAEQTPGLNKDHAMLAGLIHDIGAIPVITYAENFPELYADEKALNGAIDELRGEIGCTILEQWGFPSDLIEVVAKAEEWGFDSGRDEPSYTDIIIVAQMHALISCPKRNNLPPFNKVPAFRKLASGGLTPERSLKVMVEARHKIEEIQQVLGPASLSSE
ncbi:HDOD domain-containing protein [Alkalimarinus alittae]|uniref:HDOD domain-containing protein n=1 Tax=Alkalimarinus alittae TaxID=2961619 RepID=A0ABY6N0B2_9ALTE|nr:HDOD domain-containing protein [Alkalimarinus alittae]UZE95533.1 HDOD domain-containing protein [Alkalimarinus alittae]